MNENWNFYFQLRREPFRQLGEELILKGYAEMAFLNTGRHVVKKEIIISRPFKFIFWKGLIINLAF